MGRGAEGTLYTIEYAGYDSRRPEGWPKVLAELFVIGRPPQVPQEIESFPRTLGSGYSFTVRHVSPPMRTLPKESLAKVRQKRLKRRMDARYPMLASQLIDEEMRKKPAYYQGITDEHIENARNELLERERREYEEWMSRPGLLVVYAQEPEEARLRAMALWEEMAEVRERLANKEGTK